VVAFPLVILEFAACPFGRLAAILIELIEETYASVVEAFNEFLRQLAPEYQPVEILSSNPIH